MALPSHHYRDPSESLDRIRKEPHQECKGCEGCKYKIHVFGETKCALKRILVKCVHYAEVE